MQIRILSEVLQSPLQLPADLDPSALQVLRSLSPISLDDTVLGQYTAAGEQRGYLEDETVPKGSTTPTFATCVLHINNDRCPALYIRLFMSLTASVSAAALGDLQHYSETLPGAMLKGRRHYLAALDADAVGFLWAM